MQVTKQTLWPVWGNYVWHDLNENGLQDPTEAPISGVVVTLYASDGTTPLGTAITDGNGAYSFPNLTAGSYIVGFSNLPNAYTRTRIIGVLNDALNSDINANNQTALITLSAGTYNPNIDAGFYMGVPLGARELVATLVKQQGANQAIVNWYTKDEENTATFEIQRSTNGSDYTQVGTKAAGGNTQGQTNYSAIDDISGLEERSGDLLSNQIDRYRCTAEIFEHDISEIGNDNKRWCIGSSDTIHQSSDGYLCGRDG
ncbi:MAG: carboxypeptidase regulatory-like domain-containing protein [Bacteroidetes bacterium]|nr:carboxypeptidase regulatory-like domain-containing protein [Bacteroidota bacterium]